MLSSRFSLLVSLLALADSALPCPAVDRRAPEFNYEPDLIDRTVSADDYKDKLIVHWADRRRSIGEVSDVDYKDKLIVYWADRRCASNPSFSIADVLFPHAPSPRGRRLGLN